MSRTASASMALPETWPDMGAGGWVAGAGGVSLHGTGIHPGGITELKKIKQYAPQAGVVVRIRVPNTGSMVEPRALA